MTTTDRTDTSSNAASEIGTASKHRALWATAAAGALMACGIIGSYALAQRADTDHAVNLFERALADRSTAYEEQADAIAGLHKAEATLTSDYPLLLGIGTTLTDTTVADPATRADLLSKVTAYAETDLALDGSGTFIAERPALFGELVQAPLAAAEDRPVGEFTADELRNQTETVKADTDSVRAYIDLVELTTAEISDAAIAAAASVDLVMASASEKGVTLAWAKAPAETAAVVAAAKALVPADGAALPLVDRAALVSAYVSSVNTAAAAHQAVLDQEAEAARQAEAARRAAEAEAARQAAAQRQTQRSSGSSTPSSRGSTGGTSPSTRSVPPGGGSVGDPNKKGVTGQCWTTNGAGGTMPCGGW